MTFCTTCGQTIRDTAKFCPHCGQPVAQPATTRGTSVDMPCLIGELARAGWKNVGPGSYMGMEFNCVGSRKALGMVQWNVLVKFMPLLDSEATTVWADSFKQMNKQAQSWVMGKCFILCLVAQEIDPVVLGSIQSNGFGLFGVFRMKGGGGTILIGDESNHQVYGEIPRLPRDVHNYMTGTMKALMRCLTPEAMVGSV